MWFTVRPEMTHYQEDQKKGEGGRSSRSIDFEPAHRRLSCSRRTRLQYSTGKKEKTYILNPLLLWFVAAGTRTPTTALGGVGRIMYSTVALCTTYVEVFPTEHSVWRQQAVSFSHIMFCSSCIGRYRYRGILLFAIEAANY